MLSKILLKKNLKSISTFFKCVDPRIQTAEKVMDKLFDNYDIENIGLSLNGGKDSSVIYYLTLYFLEKKNIKKKLKCIYMKEKNPFKEILKYLEELKKSDKIELIEYSNDQKITKNYMKESLKHFTETYNIKAIILGTRSTDPFAQNLSYFQKTDTQNNWPEFTRVLPVYDWDYQFIWKFILDNKLPYCDLYRKGYTYVGDQINSIINPFIFGRHACNGNDNIELFSRTSVFNDLERKNGRIFFDFKFLQLFLKNGDKKIIEEVDKKIILQELKKFCDERSYFFEMDFEKLAVSYYNDKEDENLIKIERILEFKRKKGNQFKLYLFIFYDLETNIIKFSH